MAKKKPARSRVAGPFSKNLRSILKEREISQKSAAAIAEVSPATIADWLSGSSPADYTAVQRLCRSLDIDFEFLITGSQSKRSTQHISMTELFDAEPDPTFSGIFEISARRLKRKGGDSE